jgi:hypothetical protein
MILIHIGLAKCASSSIQAFFNVNRKRLRRASVFYSGPGRAGLGKAHHNIANEILERRRFDPDLGALADVARVCRRHPDGLIVLSSEIFERADEQSIAKLKEVFAAENVRILLVVRSLLSQLRSSYAQRIRHGKHSYDFDEFFKFRIREERISSFVTASRWAGVFGWDNMVLRVLDRAHLLNGDLFDDLLDIIGLDPHSSWASLDLERPGVFNPSPGWKVLEAVRALYTSRHGLDDHHPLLELVRQPGEIEGLGWCTFKIGNRRGWNAELGQYYTRAQADICVDIFSRAVDDLNRHLSQKLPDPPDLRFTDFKEREFLPDAARICPEELNSFYEELWSRLSKRESA